MLELSGMTTMLAVNVVIALVGVGFALISINHKGLPQQEAAA